MKNTRPSSKLSPGLPRLARMNGMRSGCGDVLRKMADGWQLMRWESSWSGERKKPSWFLHRGQMMGGEDESVLPSVAEDLLARQLIVAGDKILNGWVTTFRQTKD